MSVGIVACQPAVVEPEDAFGSEELTELLFCLFLRFQSVTVGGKQTGGSGEDGAASVAFDASAFENKVATVGIDAVEESRLV